MTTQTVRPHAVARAESPRPLPPLATPVATPTLRSQLTPAGRRLLDLLDHVWFGRVEDLVVRGGEPAFDRPPRVTLTLKITGKVDPRPPRDATGRQPVTPEQHSLLAHLAALGDGLVRRVEVSHAVPLFVEVYDDPRPAA